VKQGKTALVFIAAIAFLHVACSKKQSVEVSRPNILFLFTDDQTFNTIHALGNDVIQTPAMDRLVHEGFTFTNTYNMGAWHGAVCVASRTMMNTGQFVWRARRNEQRLKQLAEEGKLWSQLMQAGGYETYFSGKWHVAIPPDSIFNHVGHVRPGMPKDTPEGYNRPVEGKPDIWSPYDTAFGGHWAGGKHWSEVLADDVEQFIELAGESEKPFFMYLAFNAPHDPRQSPKEYVDMYAVDVMPLPENFMEEYPYNGKIGYGRELRDEKLAPFPRTPFAIKTHMREYFASITYLDQQIGRILNALEKSGKKDNTYIFFSSDNGLAVGSHGFMGKQSMYDHSIRMPLMVVGPDIPKNMQSNADVYLQDIMATSLELAGIPKPQFVEFNSFLDLIQGRRTVSHYDAIYGCYTNAQRMVRTAGYKLIAYPEVPVLLLYDVKNDPLEIHDLSGDPAYDTLKRSLFSELINLQQNMMDTADISFMLSE